MKTTVAALAVPLFFWFNISVQAQQYTASVKHYGPEHGLSHREVNAVFQDRQGFMWFGTKFGLNRFDGVKFTSYTKEDNGLGFDDIQSIAQDAEGILWLMGPYGQSKITLLNPLTQKAVSFEEKFQRVLPSITSGVPQRLLSSGDGTIFFAAYQPAVLISYHPRSGLKYVPLPRFKSLAVVQATAGNTVWAIGDGQHLVELTPDGRIQHQYSHQQQTITICLGQRNAGVEFFYFTANSEKQTDGAFYSIDESGDRRELPSSLLKSLNRYMVPVSYAFDRTGLIWDGINLHDLANGVLLTIAGQTGGESVTNRSFYRDRNGLFWLETSFGLYQVKVAENNFNRLFYPENNQKDSMVAIRGITVLGDSVYANLEKHGLHASIKLGGSARRVDIPKGFPPNNATLANAIGLTHDQEGTLYGSIGDQFVRYSSQTGTYVAAQLPQGSEVWALHQTSPQQWVLGGPRGLLWFNDKEQLSPFTQYNQFTELAQAHVLHIAPDRQGQLWVCANTGLYSLHLEIGITARYWSGGEDNFYLPADSYQHFYQDPQGIYWLATANAGLIRWDRQQNQYRQFRRSEGLSNDNIYAVYPDEQGYLWMSSDYGIIQFDPTRFTTRAYFTEDGITHNEFNRIAHHKDIDGRLYFGGLNGITAFDPRDFQSTTPATGLPLRITSFRQYDNSEDKIVDKTVEVAMTNTITIKPDDRSSVLEFAMLNYTNADKNVYAYQLTGIDKEWTYQGEPILRPSNLPYGNHQLLIKAQAASGQWSDNTLSIKLVVVRPIYMRIWFLVLITLLTGAGIWAWLRWRIWRHQVEQLMLQDQIREATARIDQDKKVIELQAQDLQRHNETRSRFFTNISHEFRTPLTVILGMAAELKRTNTPDWIQKFGRIPDLIERNGNNLLRLINQILDLSKIEAGEMHLHLVRADLVSFTRYIGESFQSNAKAMDIQVHFLSDEETCVADFSQEKLGDILSNLLSNALKFTPTSGHIYCHLKLQDSWQPLSPLGFYEELTPTSYLNSPWIQFSVRDTGIGIEPISLPKIFNRFYQADNHLASQLDGTGIGLSLVRELVLLMHGGLAVRSRPGHGAEFVVSLPLTRQAQPSEEPLPTPLPLWTAADEWVEPSQIPASNGPTLLLVEDNSEVAAYIQGCLGTDYRVLRANNGDEGIELALEKIPDIILSDVMMPLKDGLELCDTLKNDERTSHIPIVLLTAKAAVSDRIAGLRRGADAYLVKPFQREELLLVLVNLIQTRRMLQVYFSQLALGVAPAEPAPAAIADSLEDQFLTKLRTMVEAHLDNPELSVDTICQEVGMSRTTLHLKITALTGMSINRYVRMLRLLKAQELLSSSGLNVSEVAYAVGFGNPKYFIRLFSQEFGVSPGNYRQTARG